MASSHREGEERSSIAPATLVELLGQPRESYQPIRHVVHWEAADVSPWFPLVDFRVNQCYPNASLEEYPVLVAAYCSAFADSTESAYLGKLRQFASFCAQHDPILPCMPASMESVHLFLAHLALQGHTGAQTLPQYVSAINSVHKLLQFPPPITEEAVGHKQFLRGLQNILQPLQPRVEKLPFLIQWVAQAIQRVLNHPEGVFLVKVCAIVVGYVCGFRGSTLAALQWGDLQLTDSGFIVATRVQKTRQVGQPIEQWQFFTNSCPELRQLVGVFLAAHPSKPGPLWAWLGAPLPRVYNEPLMDDWVRDVLAVVDPSVQAPLYSSHSLRVGLASALNVLGLPHSTIRTWIRWASEDMVPVYVRVIPLHDLHSRYFGWMHGPRLVMPMHIDGIVSDGS